MNFKTNLNSKIFVIILIVVSILVLYKLSKNSNAYNYLENRYSNKFQKITINQLLSKEF